MAIYGSIESVSDEQPPDVSSIILSFICTHYTQIPLPTLIHSW